MGFILQCWQPSFAIFCGWVNERQRKMVKFQNAQFETPPQKLDKQQLLLTDDPRRVPASCFSRN